MASSLTSSSKHTAVSSTIVDPIDTSSTSLMTGYDMSLPSDLPSLNIDTDLSELSDAVESPTSPFMTAFHESVTSDAADYRMRSFSAASLTALPQPVTSTTFTPTLIMERPMRKRSCSSISAWALADQLSRCSLVEPDEMPSVPSEPIVYQRRASAHMLDAYSRRRHQPYAAPIRIMAPTNAITTTNNMMMTLPPSIESNDESSIDAEKKTATTTSSSSSSSSLSSSYYSYKMSKSSLYTATSNNSQTSAKCSPVTAAAIVYLSRRGRRNAIGSASHELILTRRVCRQMPA
ncbi:hypothetical protein BDF22DRAFT_682417 [Syncephalis plumigaleata]|nr:hypothetical protein BDF22DRAFT_682417 [Syncephalis plumigaleata]